MADAGSLIKQLRDAYKKQDLKTSKTLLSQIKVVTVAYGCTHRALHPALPERSRGCLRV